MTISTATITAIQKAGAATLSAYERLKKDVNVYGDKVNKALTSNPFEVRNDTLFENWKVAARLSQSIAALEDELKKIHRIASDLASEAAHEPTHQVMALPTPTPMPSAGSKSMPTIRDAVDVTPKTVKPKVKGVKASAKAVAAKVSKAGLQGAAKPVSSLSNVEKLTAFFAKVLNAKIFVPVSLKSASLGAGVPMGSMNAAIKKMLDAGKIVADGKGGYKAIQGTQRVAKTAPAPAPAPVATPVATPVAKSAAATKTTAATKAAVAKPAKPAVPPAAKVPAKVSKKPALKPEGKSAAQPVAQPAAKSVARPVAKVSVKPAPKPAAKKASKVTTPVAATTAPLVAADTAATPETTTTSAAPVAAAFV